MIYNFQDLEPFNLSLTPPPPPFQLALIKQLQILSTH
jgi:hypothetical protein